MIPKPVIHPLALQHLRELRERWGVEPTLEEQLWIVRLCDRVINPVAGERRDLLGIPVRIGASQDWLWPITIGGCVWWQDLASDWFAGDTDMQHKSLAFALANGRSKPVMQACRTRAEAEAMMWQWEIGLTCTIEELDAAVNEVLPPRVDASKPSDEPKRTDWQAVCGELEAITGIPCDHWIWEVSREETERAWTRANLVAAAMGGMPCPDADTPEDEAVRDLATAKASIIASRAKGSES